jgi:hypothetical protein
VVVVTIVIIVIIVIIVAVFRRVVFGRIVALWAYFCIFFLAHLTLARPRPTALVALEAG